jgi:hypothetical protein
MGTMKTTMKVVKVLAATVVLCMCRNSDGGVLDMFKQAGVEPDAGNGVLTLKTLVSETPVSEAAEGTTYWADVYDYQDAITDESVLLTLIGSAPQKLAAGWSVYDAGAANIPLKGTSAAAKAGKDAVFKQSGKYLTVLTAVDSTGKTTVKYKASLSFEEGNAAWDTSVGGGGGRIS